MTAALASKNAGSTSAASTGGGASDLAHELRSLAARASDHAGGGLSLIFTTAPDAVAGSNYRLRSAAGFATPQAAREAAQALLPHVTRAIEARSRQALDPIASLGGRAAHGFEIHPLIGGGSVHGALVVGLPRPLSAEQRNAVDDSIAHLSLRLEYDRLTQELSLGRSKAETDGDDEGHSEEILKLSEALFAQDIELLRSNEKIGKIEKLKNDFIEKMSRELRTPLNSIIEGIIAVLTGENEKLSEGAKETLRSALDEGSAFLRTLQNILDLWRIKQNELPVELHDMNFREMVEEAIFSIQDAIGDKPLSVEQHILEPFPKIRTDLTKVNQILFLLLDNAAKFTPEGRIEIRASVDDNELRCEVRDTGIGICADDQQFIFDEFFQVDVASSQTYTGAGLGLALVRDLITLLNGEVAVRSDVGRGTSVSFSIPIQVIG